VARRYRPTKADRDTIRDCAHRDCGSKSLRLELGEKFSSKRGDQVTSVNMALVSDGPDYSDVQLFQTLPWTPTFTEGFPMRDDGRAAIDFYVYTTGDRGELKGYITAHWEGGRLVRVESLEGKTLWETSARVPQDARGAEEGGRPVGPSGSRTVTPPAVSEPGRRSKKSAQEASREEAVASPRPPAKNASPASPEAGRGSQLLRVGSRVFDVGLPTRLGRIRTLGEEVSEVEWTGWRHKSGRDVDRFVGFVANEHLRLEEDKQ